VKTKDFELNGSKHSPNLICSYFLHDYNFGLLLLFPNIWTLPHLQRHILTSFLFYHQDLQHPNEFLRGSTLRFLCKLKEPELLEPLMPAIRACLEHRHSYVRRNAVLAIFTIYRYCCNMASYISYFGYCFIIFLITFYL